MTAPLAFIFSFVVAYLGVNVVRAVGLRRNFLDIPNERSSHLVPTPRTGGIVIVVVTLAFYCGVAYLFPNAFSWGYFAGALLVAGISLVDDIYSISIVWRLMIHSLAAVLLIYDKGGWNEFYFPGIDVFTALQRVGPVLTFIWIVWLINAYNFMDGIDGIAGVQAVAAAGGWMAVGWMTNSAAAYYLGGAILFSALAFLIHNWQPARIFMGDVGSAFLGFSFAAMPLLGKTGNEQTDSLLPIASILFVWLFVFDTVVTFIRRALRREKVWQAHREHLYQRIVQSGRSHATVSTIYGVLALAITVSTAYAFVSEQTIGYTPLIGTGAATAVLVAVYFLSQRLPAEHAKNTE
jgi:Fuc2NAc and GlcNAc transferase